MSDQPPQPDSEQPDSADDRADAAPAEPAVDAVPLRELPPFDHQRMQRDLLTDRVLRWSIVGLMLLLLIGVVSWQPDGTLAGTLAICLVFVAWVMMSSVSARVSRDGPRLMAMIQQSPELAEDVLAGQMGRRPLLNWVRLALYQRLATLRHRQRRFGEAAAICQAVLAEPVGLGKASRPHLLLMLAESQLECRNLIGAHSALVQLYHRPLSLVEALQRLALQTRYELLSGYYESVASQLDSKRQLAELMPPPQCGAMHAMLAVAARAAGRSDDADLLWRRVELLLTPEQLKAVQSGEFAWGIVASPSDAAGVGVGADG